MFSTLINLSLNNQTSHDIMTYGIIRIVYKCTNLLLLVLLIVKTCAFVFCFCRSTVPFRKQETHFFILRVLVGLIILYDHVHPNGAFVKSSGIDVKGCVRLLKDQSEKFETENLLNALRYMMILRDKCHKYCWSDQPVIRKPCSFLGLYTIRI